MDIRWRGKTLQASAMAAATWGFVVMAGAPAQAGPCTADISQLETQVKASASNPVAGPAEAQSVGAQLHHQPTPGEVQSAQTRANADADAALDRARKSDDQGDAGGCQEALRQARSLYGLANN